MTKIMIYKICPRQNRHSNIDKKESKMKMQLLFVALERLDGQRPSQREKGPHRLL